MDCAECGAREGTPTRVEYIDDTTEVLPLCRECREEYDGGAFVEDVTVDADTTDY